jgi:hypothetical protein
MTMLADLNQYAGGDTHPAFKFKRIGDAVKGKILRSKIVEFADRETGKPKTSLVIDIEVQAAKGGIANKGVDEDGMEKWTIVDVPAGDTVTVWLNPGFGIGAVRDALAQAGAQSLEDGGTLKVKLAEKRDTGKQQPANVFEAEYEAPKGGVSIDEL